MRITRGELVPPLLLGLALALGWLAYAPALGGALLFDDIANLNGLAKVEDMRSALIFICTGEAGPVGRPLALATFALQADAWGGAARPFILLNIAIHLFNACLLAWVLHRLAALSGIPEQRRTIVAIAAAAIWLFMPLLASSSLMVIQRMTTLSATFVLLGLGGYLQARAGMGRSPGRSLLLMTVCLVIGTTLAVLAKESGALLPVYVLVLEATVLPRPAILDRRWAVWKGVFLVVPAVVIAIYLALVVPYDPALVLRRDFTGWERVITEGRILWQYLFRAFVPQPGAFGPFHDGYPVARTIADPLTFLAAAGWLIALGLAVLWRRKRPLYALGVLWFLAGHSIESTVVALELYFEHRNYVPIVGPLFALCAGLAYVPAARWKLACAGISAYVLVNAAVLFGLTSVWGDPPTAARVWERHFPDSVRAATTAATYRLATEGPQGAMQSLHSLVDRVPTAAYELIPALSLSCIIAPQADHDPEVRQLVELLPKADFSYTPSTMLSDLYTTVSRAGCNGVTGATVTEVAEALRRNPRYAKNGAYERLHHQLVARILRDEGRLEQALAHLEQAAGYERDAALNMMIVTTYADAREFDAARDYIETARDNPPLHPFKRIAWESGLDELQIYITKLEELHAASAGPGGAD